MSIYREAQPPPRRAPRAPWWRLLRAWADGTLTRIEMRRGFWIVTDQGAGLVRVRIRKQIPVSVEIERP